MWIWDKVFVSFYRRRLRRNGAIFRNDGACWEIGRVSARHICGEYFGQFFNGLSCRNHSGAFQLRKCTAVGGGRIFRRLYDIFNIFCGNINANAKRANNFSGRECNFERCGGLGGLYGGTDFVALNLYLNKKFNDIFIEGFN